MRASFKQPCGMSVPEVMKSSFWTSGGNSDLFKTMRQMIWVDGVADLTRENEVLISVTSSETKNMLGLAGSMVTK
jgi:hypothetical protein